MQTGHIVAIILTAINVQDSFKSNRNLSPIELCSNTLQLYERFTHYKSHQNAICYDFNIFRKASLNKKFKLASEHANGRRICSLKILPLAASAISPRK